MSALLRVRVGLAAVVAILLWILLHPSGSLASHPVGAVSESSASKIGNPKLKLVECLDCHVSHGAADPGLLAGRDHGAGACQNCHKGLDLKHHAGSHPIGQLVPKRPAESLIAVGGVLGPNNTIVCGSCHSTHKASRITDRCYACHEEQAKMASMVTTEKGHRSAICTDCHNQDLAKVKATAVRVDGDPDNCLRCHGPGSTNQSIDAHPGQAGHALVDKPGGFDAKDKELNGCASCHGGHEIVRPDSNLCEECHTVQAEDHARGGHGTATCIDCHPPHEAKTLHADAIDHHINPVSRRCLACHAEDVPGNADVPRVEAFEHPAPVFLPDGPRWVPPIGSLPLFDAAGVKAPPEVNGDLTCASCHLSHGPDRNKPGDSLRRPGWEAACSACHGAEGLLYYRWFHYRERLEGAVTPMPKK